MFLKSILNCVHVQEKGPSIHVYLLPPYVHWLPVYAPLLFLILGAIVSPRCANIHLGSLEGMDAVSYPRWSDAVTLPAVVGGGHCLVMRNGSAPPCAPGAPCTPFRRQEGD
jgi:hypothetical protein